MHTLLFLEPAHFHAALTLRERHPLANDEVVVYAAARSDAAEFLALVQAFNARAERPTRWRPEVREGERPLERLLADGGGDLVVLAGKNDGKLARMRRLHDAGFAVLADKPWLIRPEQLADVRHVLRAGPVTLEIMTGRHEVTSRLAERLVSASAVFGEFDTAGEPAIRLASVHHLEKRVNGAPLRRPPWYFDVRVQGDGLADIPTHLVDQAQRLLASRGRPTDRAAELLGARRWPTPVPRALFARVTGRGDFPPELREHVQDDTLAYLANAELTFRLRGVGVRVTTRWALSEPPGGGDLHQATIAGTRACIRISQGPETGFRRRLVVEPRGEAAEVGRALAESVGAWQADHPGLAVLPAPGGFEVEIPAALRTGHESHFPLVLDECLTTIGEGRWPDRRAETLAKYELIARALATPDG